MRILEIKGQLATIQVEATELDTIVNNYLDQQYAIGYDEGYNDWKRACGNADMDDDHTYRE